MDSPEFKTAYGTDSTALEFVTRIYTNVLDRAPDPAGRDYWVNAINQGFARAEVLALVSESPENQAAVIGSIQDGADYAPYG
jgi:hypothetical protein